MPLRPPQGGTLMWRCPKVSAFRTAPKMPRLEGVYGTRVARSPNRCVLVGYLERARLGLEGVSWRIVFEPCGLAVREVSRIGMATRVQGRVCRDGFSLCDTSSCRVGLEAN